MVAYLYILPGLAAYLVFTFFPVLQTVRLSFYDWDGFTAKRWIGFGNYRKLWHDAEIHAAFLHSVELILFYAVFSIMLGLFLTALMTHLRVRGFNFFRTVLFLPQTIATVVVAQAFVWIYDPSGPLDEFLRAIGLGSFAKVWLGDFTWALPAVGMIGTVDHLRALPGAVPRRRAEDPSGAVRGRTRRRRGLLARVRRGDAPGPAKRARRGGDADDDHRAAQLRHHLQHDGRRPRRRDRGAVVGDVPERVRVAPRRLRGCDRDGADGDHLRRRHRHRPAVERALVTSRLDRYTTYVVLVAFSFLALYPIISIVFLAFHKKTDLVTGFSLPTTFSPHTFVYGVERGQLRPGHVG